LKKVKSVGVLCALLFSVFWLNGCLSVGPDYEQPEVSTPDVWGQELTDDFKSDSPDIQYWWEQFDDALLDALIQRTSTNNPDLRIAAERINEAAALRGVAKSFWFPQISGDGSVTGLKASRAVYSFLPEGKDTATQYSIGGSMGWELDLWGRVRRMVESSDASMQASIEDYRDTLVILYSEVAFQYIQVRSLQSRIRLAEDSVKLQQDTMQLTLDRNKAGLAPDLDVYQAQMNLAQTKSTIPPLRIMLAQAIHRLSVLAGLDPSALNELLQTGEGVAQIPATPQKFAVGLPADLLRQRPDVRAAERRLASQHAMIGAKKAELYPTFTLPGTLALQAYNVGDLDSDALTYGFGPAFRWNLFSGGRIRGEVKAEESRTRQATISYEKTVLYALEEVENAMVSLHEEKNHVALLREAVLSASKSVELVKSLYKAGLTDFQNVLSTEAAYTLQRDNLASAEGAVARSAVQLYKALGGGWAPAVAQSAEVEQAAEGDATEDAAESDNKADSKTDK
jgi:NodT family efflux transporter outer membrane factor (OMF) lipoprotein